MTIIVNSGSTLVVPSTGLTLTADSTIAAGGTLLFSDGGTISGGFDLVNDGVISDPSIQSAIFSIDTSGFNNQGTINVPFHEFIIQAPVNLANLTNGTLTGGVWNVLNGVNLLDGTISTLGGVSFDLEGSNFETGPGGIGTQPIANTLTEIGGGATLSLNNSTWSAPGALNVDGQLNLNDETLAATGGITISATGSVSGTGGTSGGAWGTIQSSLVVNGIVNSFGLTLDGPYRTFRIISAVT
jgi:hypothetical protein